MRLKADPRSSWRKFESARACDLEQEDWAALWVRSQALTPDRVESHCCLHGDLSSRAWASTNGLMLSIKLKEKGRYSDVISCQRLNQQCYEGNNDSGQGLPPKWAPRRYKTGFLDKPKGKHWALATYLWLIAKMQRQCLKVYLKLGRQIQSKRYVIGGCLQNDASKKHKNIFSFSLGW